MAAVLTTVTAAVKTGCVTRGAISTAAKKGVVLSTGNGAPAAKCDVCDCLVLAEAEVTDVTY